MKYTEEEMTEVRIQRDANWNLYQGTKKEYDQFILDVVERLNPLKPLPAITDKTYALTLLDEHIKEFSELQTLHTQAEKKWDLQRSELEDEKKVLNEKIENLEEKVVDLLGELEYLRKRVDEFNTKTKETEKWESFLGFIKKLFERKK